jgi:hypothetical protein
MKQQLEKEDQRDVARRLFHALCAQFPDRYIVLVEPPDVVNDRPPPPAFTIVELRQPDRVTGSPP